MNTKRMLAFILSICMIFSFRIVSFSADEAIFTDVDPTTEQGRDIEKLYTMGIIDGNGDGTFAPQREVTRAELCKMINKICGYNTLFKEGFTDVTADKWYYEDVLIAREAGFVQGYPDGTFRGDDNVTREEASAIISRTFKVEYKGEAVDISDEVSDWAISYVKALVVNKVIKLEAGNIFRATEAMKRGELASALSGFVGSDKDDTEENKPSGGGSISGGGSGNSGSGSKPSVKPSGGTSGNSGSSSSGSSSGTKPGGTTGGWGNIEPDKDDENIIELPITANADMIIHKSVDFNSKTKLNSNGDAGASSSWFAIGTPAKIYDRAENDKMLHIDKKRGSGTAFTITNEAKDSTDNISYAVMSLEFDICVNSIANSSASGDLTLFQGYLPGESGSNAAVTIGRHSSDAAWGDMLSDGQYGVAFSRGEGTLSVADDTALDMGTWYRFKLLSTVDSNTGDVKFDLFIDDMDNSLKGQLISAESGNSPCGYISGDDIANFGMQSGDSTEINFDIDNIRLSYGYNDPDLYDLFIIGDSTLDTENGYMKEMLSTYVDPELILVHDMTDADFGAEEFADNEWQYVKSQVKENDVVILSVGADDTESGISDSIPMMLNDIISLSAEPIVVSQLPESDLSGRDITSALIDASAGGNFVNIEELIISELADKAVDDYYSSETELTAEGRKLAASLLYKNLWNTGDGLILNSYMKDMASAEIKSAVMTIGGKEYKGYINTSNNKISFFADTFQTNSGLTLKAYSDAEYAAAFPETRLSLAPAFEVNGNLIGENSAKDYSEGSINSYIIESKDQSTQNNYDAQLYEMNVAFEDGFDGVSCFSGDGADNRDFLPDKSYGSYRDKGNGMFLWDNANVWSSDGNHRILGQLTKDPDNASNDVYKVTENDASATASLILQSMVKTHINRLVTDYRIRIDDISEIGGIFMGRAEYQYSSGQDRRQVLVLEKGEGNTIDVKYDSGKLNAVTSFESNPTIELDKWVNIRTVQTDELTEDGSYRTNLEVYIDGEYAGEAYSDYADPMGINRRTLYIGSLPGTTYSYYLDTVKVSYSLTDSNDISSVR